MQSCIGLGRLREFLKNTSRNLNKKLNESLLYQDNARLLGPIERQLENLHTQPNLNKIQVQLCH